MSIRRVVAYHIARLNDKRADIRLESIEELRLICNSDCLEALQKVYTNDESREVRRAAQEAGREIYLKTKLLE